MNVLILRSDDFKRSWWKRLPWLVLALMVSLVFALQSCATGDTSAPREKRPGAAREGKKGDGGGGSSAMSSSTKASRGGGIRTTGETVEIRKSWIQIRSAPNENAQAIALAFGNDELPVVSREGDWVQVRFARNRAGWIPEEALSP